jgi:hypothetical protein
VDRLLNDRMFEQFDEFLASVEIKESTFEGLHAENLSDNSIKARNGSVASDGLRNRIRGRPR